MAGVPFFIEALTSSQNSNLQVCWKIRAALFKEQITPLPFASSISEVADVLNSLKIRGTAPAIFVVNTFWADELLSQVDPFIGQTPVVYLRRQLFSECRNSTAISADPNTSVILRKMTPRLSVRWLYGSQSAAEVAVSGAKALLRFLRDGSFSALENYAHTQTYEMLKSRCDNGEDPAWLANSRVLSRPKPSGAEVVTTPASALAGHQPLATNH
jgi:hypothetical protein